MKRLLLLLCLIVTACATPDPKTQEFVAWQQTEMARAEAGQVPWGMYYARTYDRLLDLPVSAQRNTMLRAVSDLIPVARQYDARKISKEQLDDARRAANLHVQESELAVQAAHEERVRSANVEAMRRMSQPQRPIYTPVPAPAPPVTCVTNKSLGSLYTTCR